MEKKGKDNRRYRRGIMTMMNEETHSDVLGSYTGTPVDPDDIVPTQDADDL